MHFVPFSLIFLTLFCYSVQAQEETEYIPVGKGWAKSSVNTVIFRQASVFTYKNMQYTAYYNPAGSMVIAKRKHGTSEWEKHVTRYTGNVKDAHNSISIGVDGNGLLHVAWDHHGHQLNYAQSQRPGTLTLTDPKPMTGQYEQAVTYPQFYHLPGGDLLFVYRDGSSGNGNVMLNRWDVKQQTWKTIAHPLIDGEGERNAYINTVAIDKEDNWHISWTWRETWDASTNHDIMYATSPNQGDSWYRSDGQQYKLPITEKNGEVVWHISQGSELINQTSMTINSDGEPVIASYWKADEDESPQYRIIWKQNDTWKSRQVTDRSQSFSLTGGGTKRIPISRPQILAGDHEDLYLVFRDFARGGGITVATSADKYYKNWSFTNIYDTSIGLWEPTFDPVMWKSERELHLFGQKVGQGDGETLEKMEPQEVFILEWIPPLYKK